MEGTGTAAAAAAATAAAGVCQAGVEWCSLTTGQLLASQADGHDVLSVCTARTLSASTSCSAVTVLSIALSASPKRQPGAHLSSIRVAQLVDPGAEPHEIVLQGGKAPGGQALGVGLVVARGGLFSSAVG